MHDHLKQIAILVDQWIAENKSARNLSQLARLIGVNYHILRRVMSGETELSFTVASHILAVVTKPGIAVEVLKSSWPNELKAVEAVLTKTIRGGQFFNEDVPRPDINMITLSIFTLSNRPQGMTKEEIEAEFGREGGKSIESLAKAGVIQNKEGKYFAVGWPMVNVSDLTQGARGILDLYSRKNLGSAKTDPICIRIGTLNRRNKERLEAAQKKFLAEVEDIFMECHLDDDIPVKLAYYTVYGVSEEGSSNEDESNV